MATSFPVKVFEILFDRFFLIPVPSIGLGTICNDPTYFLFVCLFCLFFFEAITKKHKLGLLSYRLIYHRVRRDPLQRKNLFPMQYNKPLHHQVLYMFAVDYFGYVAIQVQQSL